MYPISDYQEWPISTRTLDLHYFFSQPNLCPPINAKMPNSVFIQNVTSDGKGAKTKFPYGKRSSPLRKNIPPAR